MLVLKLRPSPKYDSEGRFDVPPMALRWAVSVTRSESLPSSMLKMVDPGLSRMGNSRSNPLLSESLALLARFSSVDAALPPMPT